MRTQIIHLERHDDFVSVRDKMAWGQTGRLLLVWPERGKVLTRLLDLIVVARHADTLGVQLGLVTKDLLVRDHARSLKLPCFPSIEHARRGRWQPRNLIPVPARKISPGVDIRQHQAARMKPPGPAWMQFAGFRVTFFLAGLLSVLSLCGFLLPSAQVEIILPRIEQTLQLPILAGETIHQVSPAGLLPLRTISVQVEGYDRIPSSGWSNIPDRYAEGEVRFTNLTDKAVEIPSGTVVMAVIPEKIRFLTTQDGKLAPGVQSFTVIPIRAAFSGEQGNLDRNTIRAIEGRLGVQASVDNPEPTRGGSVRQVRSPTTTDRVNLRTRLLETLTTRAGDDMRNQVGQEAIFVESSLAVDRILEERATPLVNEPAGELEISMRVEFKAFYIKESDLETLARMALEANRPSGYQPAGEEIRLQMQGEMVVDPEGRLAGSVQASRWLVAPIQVGEIVERIKGRPVQPAVKSLMAAYELEQSPQVLLSPGWWPVFPFLGPRIAVGNPPG